MKPMTVRDLKMLLETLDPDAWVDLSRDEEGNSYGGVMPMIGFGKKIDGSCGVVLYPIGGEMPESRYDFDDADAQDRTVANKSLFRLWEGLIGAMNFDKPQ